MLDNIGGYEVLRVLGEGATATVYLARDPRDRDESRMVAIKTFRGAQGDEGDWRNRRRLVTEADRGGSLHHPNIVEIYHYDPDNEPPYIVMEYVEGPTLGQFLASGDPPEIDLAMSILRETADALDHAHSEGIIHRDIKPSNVMLDTANHVKITDFGVAKREGMLTYTSSRFVGTPHYMSPEQFEGRTDIDGRADQFALAIIAYQMLTGRKPFNADTVTALSRMVTQKAPPRPSRWNPHLNRQVDGVIRKALSKNRDRRYMTCTEFVNELETALAQAPGRGVPVWAPAAAAGVLLVALVVIGWVFCWFGGERCVTTLNLTPDHAVLQPGQSQQFAVTGGDVRWSISPEGAGTITSDGIYKAPADTRAERSVTVTATSVANESVKKAVEITLAPVPEPTGPTGPRGPFVLPESASLRPGQAMQFSSSVAGVKWTVSPNVGTVNSNGLYRAPAHNGMEQTVTVSAVTPEGARGSATVELRAVAAPPPPPAPSIVLRVYAKDVALKPGGTAPVIEGKYWVGDLSCYVAVNGVPKGAKLRLVWSKDGEEADVSEFDPPDERGLRVRYGNAAEPGKYRVRVLLNGKPVNAADVTFVIPPSKS